MSLSTELSALLEKHSVTTVVKTRLVDIDCTSVSKLANWVDEKKELKVVIMASITTSTIVFACLHYVYDSVPLVPLHLQSRIMETEIMACSTRRCLHIAARACKHVAHDSLLFALASMMSIRSFAVKVR
jgi:hypothetical protein